MDDDSHQVGKGRWKVPAGSIAIDIGLVLMLAYSAGQWTKAVEALDARLQRLESMQILPESARRLSVLEAQMQHLESERAILMAQLSRIEDKLDQHMDGKPHKDM